MITFTAANLDTGSQHREAPFRWPSFHLREVFFVDMAARMQELVSKRSIVREEQDTRCVAIETPDVIERRILPHRKQVGDTFTSRLLSHRAIYPGWLVERQDHELVLHEHRTTIEHNLIAVWVDLCAQFRYDNAIHADAALEDELFATTPSTATGTREILLQPDGLERVFGHDLLLEIKLREIDLLDHAGAFCKRIRNRIAHCAAYGIFKRFAIKLRA